MQTYARGGACTRRGAIGTSGSIASGEGQELSSGSRAISRRFSSDIFQGKNGSMSDGTRPPFCAQLSRNHVSQLRMLILAMVNVANREKSIAASRPLHNAPEPY